jgi:hypothetical protein
MPFYEIGKIEREILGKTVKRKSAIEEFRKIDKFHEEESLRVGQVPLVLCPVPATRPEAMVYNFLTKLQIPFVFQYQFPDIQKTEETENFRPDFYIPDYNVIIEVQGSYWHTLPDSHESDLNKTAKMLLEGKKVLWWWDWEIERNLTFLFTRDLPELYDTRIERPVGGPAPYLGDIEEDLKAQRARKAAMQKHNQAGIWQTRDPYYSKKRLEKKEISAIRYKGLYVRPREPKLNTREFKSISSAVKNRNLKREEAKLLKSLSRDLKY